MCIYILQTSLDPDTFYLAGCMINGSMASSVALASEDPDHSFLSGYQALGSGLLRACLEPGNLTRTVVLILYTGFDEVLVS